MNYRSLTSGIAFISILFLLTSFTIKKDVSKNTLNNTDPLYDSIVKLDTEWEEAYNNCKMDQMIELISEDLEFYHDQGGLTTSKKLLLEALQKNICGKVTRHLKKGSIEVYAIPGYGAVEMGMHGFRNINDTGTGSGIHYAKFIHLWKKEDGIWRITRVISLH